MKKFPWLFTLLWLGILAVMVSAGFWQLGRAEEKRQIQQRLAAEQPERPVFREDWQNLQAFAPVSIYGRFEPVHFLLSNQIIDGQVGYFAFTAFRTSEQLLLLINRGWVANHDQPLDVAPVHVELTGLVADWPRPGFQLGEQPLSDEHRQVVTYLPDDTTQQWLAAQLCADRPCQVLPKVMKLDAAAPHGFVRKWQQPVMTPAKHQAYAVQWFSMSAVLCLVWLIFIRKHYASKN
jgi:surfeit locus 1 family protein